VKVNEKITAADVRASINPDIEEHPSMSWFGRPLSNFITPFFHNRGWSANDMTVARTWLAMAAVSALAFPEPLFWQVSAFIYYICIILDCVDGNLARVQDDASYLGKFLDGLADSIYPMTATFFLGIGAWQHYDEPLFLVIGSLISIVSITNQMLRNRLSFFREWMVGLTGELTEEELVRAKGPRGFQQLLALVIVNGYFLAMIGLMIPAYGAYLFFALCFLAQLIPDFLWICSSIAESYALLKRGRKSRHAWVAETSD
jgi:phosphatidylglycerophosphate synthase